MLIPAPLHPHALSLSFMTNNQRHLWAGQELYGPLPIYNTPYTFEILGELHPLHFQNAFQTLINSCDVFRTIIREIQGTPVPILLPSFPYTMEYCDYTHSQDPDQAAQAWTHDRMQRVLALHECLFDSALIRVSRTQWIWFYNVHHLISDGLTVSLMFERMSKFYGQSLMGTLEEEEAQPQFYLFAEWEAAFLKSERHKKGGVYWEKILQNHLPPLQLYGHTLDSQLVPIQRVTYPLDHTTTHAIRLLAESLDNQHPPKPSTLCEIFATLFFAYLFRISGNRHLSMGIPFHARPAGPFKTTLGLFVEIAPLIIDIAPTETFETLWKKIHREIHDISRHFRSNPTRALQQRPYHVLFNFHLATFPHFHEIPVKTTWHHIGMANVGLTFNVQDFNKLGTFTLDLDINAKQFDQTQQHRILEHILSLLQAFLKDPSQPLGASPMLSDSELHSVLQEYNESQEINNLKKTEEEIAHSTQGLHHLFEAQVVAHQDAVAVVF
jgi:hypothetical protein